MLLAAALVLLLPAAPSQAQSATTFVSNTGQTITAGSAIVGQLGDDTFKQAQTFTTGANDGGYTLTEVGLRVDRWIGNAASLSAKIYSTTSDGAPDSELYTLTNPTTTSDDAVNTFTVA